MTKLAPIEELANQASGKLVAKADMSAIEWFFRSDVEKYDCLLTFQQLEQLRQAIIRDFVSTVEPVHSQFFDVNKWYDYLNEKHKKNTIEAGYLHRDLYGLSEWSK